jgi:hypothetical protein
MTAPNFFAVFSTGMSIATGIAAAYEGYVAGGTVTVPPIRTYLGTDHVEIDVTIKHLPPP